MQEAPPAFWLFLTERLELDGSSGIDRVWNALDRVVGRGTVQRIRDGHSKLGADTVQALARKLGCTPADLQTALLGQTPVAHGLSYTPDTVPPISWEELTVTLKEGNELPAEFWLTLGDDAMAPSAPRGTRMKFTRDRVPQYGDAVLLLGPDGAPHVRAYGQNLARLWQALPANRHYDPLYGDMPGVRVLAVMTGIEVSWAQLAR